MIDDAAVVDPIVMGPSVVDRRVGVVAARVEFIVPRDLRYFKGHFPGMPVVPGVVQLKWALALARRYLEVDGACRGMEAIKFQQLMTSGVRGTLDLEYAEASGRLRFVFGSNEVRYSSGRLLLWVAS